MEVVDYLRTEVPKYIPPPPLKLLDVGCGDTPWYGSEYEIYRCDIENIDLPNFIKCNLNKQWPYADEEFSCIISMEVIEHVENPWHFMREIKRILKAGGVAVISTPNNENEDSKKEFVKSGRFVWFRPEHLENGTLGHITPVFSWQMRYICRIIGLALEIKYVHHIYDKGNLVFIVKKWGDPHLIDQCLDKRLQQNEK